ncbi:MAG TPA: type VI secretion system-associated FHA domain protein TagH [Dyella sp.]|uniref:type VI secretion system-associated FHA domain protein TagH n=1 Tax=Dyella sp. TaxID=1869338 RepID=UPI002C89B19F|nr:type VI secretion system-associated FHA domain protein TagH [Dyella sp.]HTV86024.1 type VI secretion system-associated FHA domain protein TagH [Dyella sp.]
MTATQRHITLVVSNPEILQYGNKPRHRFDRTGGTIGCRGANWLLMDHHDRIEPIHCEICLEDGHFCVVDRCGKTHINGAHAPMGRGVGARFSEGDTLQVGPYDLTVLLGDADAIDGASQSLGEDGIDPEWAGLRREGAELSHAPMSSMALRDAHAAFQALAAPDRPLAYLDPLEALDAAERATTRSSHDPLDPTHYGLAGPQPQADLGATRFEAVSGTPKTLSGETGMSTLPSDTTQAQHWLTAQQFSGGDARQLVAPLMEGLGASWGAMEGRAAYRLLQETGQALEATLRGLSALYGSTTEKEDRLSLLGRTLQPIEDNPLRLGLNYEDTVRALFGNERSAVHLSPKAAVEESLAQVRGHQAALVQAIGAGLEALLGAFSPDVLLQRFQRYQPDPAQPSGVGDWAWQMYAHYYGELASSRQLGFEKLFWEVFEQAYDRALRTEAQ